MTRTVAEKRAAFRSLHREGCFVLPDPWDAGSARLLQHLGFSALASTSAGFAWSKGRPDNAVTRDDVLQHLVELCEAVDLPVNADLNVLIMNPSTTVAELAELGVRRVSVGGALARVAWSALLAAAERIKAGSFDGLAGGTPGKLLNDAFRSFV